MNHQGPCGYAGQDAESRRPSVETMKVVRHPSADPQFVAELGEIDLRDPLDEATVSGIVSALDAHAIVIFRGQSLTDEQQLAFAMRLGVPQTAFRKAREDRKERLDLPEIVDISNLDAESNIIGGEHVLRMRTIVNRMWHTDASFQRPRGKYSMLSARAVPPSGSETQYADMRAAYDALPAKMKSTIADLSAEHSIVYSQSVMGFTEFTQSERDKYPPAEQPLVWRLPGSNRQTLYLASHASHIAGMPVPEGRILLRDLMEFATQPQFVYRHHWQGGDVVIWDNRCTMHRARQFEETEVRDMRRITTLDVDGATAESVSARLAVRPRPYFLERRIRSIKSEPIVVRAAA